MSEAPQRAPHDVRARIVAALILAFGFAAVESAATTPLLLALAAALALWGGRPSQVARGMGWAFGLALSFIVALGLTAGQTVLWRAGPVAFRAEGLEAGLLIAGRLVAIVTVTRALLAPIPPHRLTDGLRGLGAPSVIADLMLLTLRYIEELRGQMRRAALARRLRGGGGGWRALPQHGLAIAAALIRGHVRADRVWTAMRLRGHGATTASPRPLAARDRLAVAAAACAAALVVIADRMA
jgi:cobalt/nickel transport system permease protein